MSLAAATKKKFGAMTRSVKANEGSKLWQGFARKTLMGGSAGNVMPQTDFPTANIDGNYIAQKFSAMTGKIWKIGYEN